MSEGLAALLGAIVGGGLVVIGDLVGRHIEDRRAARQAVRAAAAELVSFEWHREILAFERRLGNFEISAEQATGVFEQDRRRAASAIFVSPLAEHVVSPMRQLMARTNELVEACTASDDDWETARERFAEARDRFQDAIRLL